MISHNLCSLHSQLIHSLRASNIAFKDDQGGDFFACKQYCIDTNTHGFTEGTCTSECAKRTEEELGCVDTCREDALPDSKPWDDCFCECTGNCMTTGSGLEHTSTPTIVYTRPPIGTSSPAPSPALQSSEYDALGKAFGDDDK